MPRPHQLPHTITRWRRTSTPDVYGRTTWTVETFPCRYRETNNLFVGEDGTHQRSRAYIYTEGDMLQLGDMVMKGDFATFTSPPADAFQIKSRRVTTSQDGTRIENRYVC